MEMNNNNAVNADEDNMEYINDEVTEYEVELAQVDSDLNAADADAEFDDDGRDDVAAACEDCSGWWN